MAAPACDVMAQVPASARVFAKPSGDGAWREYRTLESVPDPAGPGAEIAQYSTDANGAPSVYILGFDKDDRIYARYCFDSGNKLGSIGFLVDTRWGWGFRLNGPVVQGAIQVQSSDFFDDSSGATIAKPANADDIAAALKPTLYLETGKLPFATLLAQPAKPAAP